MNTLLVIILLVNIYIALKLREMCGSQDAIREYLININYINDAKFAYINGNMEVAKQMMDLAFLEQVKMDIELSSKTKPYSTLYKKTKRRFSDLYSVYKLEAPDFYSYGVKEDAERILQSQS